MYTSIEIFVPTKSRHLEIDTSEFTFQIKQTHPPMSDRGVSSLWQDKFSDLQGVLVHIADPATLRVRNDRYYAYDIFANPEGSHRRIKFLPEYGEQLVVLLRQACALSSDESVFLTFDAWLGPRKKIIRKILTEKKLRKIISENKSIRNSSFWKYKVRNE